MKISNQIQVYTSLKSNIDATVSFTGATLPGNKCLSPEMINNKVVQAAIPAETTAAQWAQISKASEYAKTNNVNLKIVVIMP